MKPSLSPWHFLPLLLEVSFRLFSNTRAADSTKIQSVFIFLGVLREVLFDVELSNSRLKSRFTKPPKHMLDFKQAILSSLMSQLCA